jgi:hypothetical protein
VSQEAIDYVRALVQSPAGKKIPQSQRSVLRVLAFRHNLEVNCAWPSVGDIAVESLMSECTVRRSLAKLEASGLISRHVSVRKNGSTASNEYELPGLKSMAVAQEARQRVFKAPRERIAVQMELMDVDGVSSAAAANRGASLAVELMDVVGSEGLAVVSAVEIELRCEGTPYHHGDSPPPINMVIPLEDIYEDTLKELPPLPLLRDPQCVKTSGPEASSPVCLDVARAEARTTASAKATATTSSNEAAGVPTERAGEAGMSSGTGRGRNGERERLDGLEAALWDEAEDVLWACGIARDAMTRRQRRAVMGALRYGMEAGQGSAEVAGEFAVRQWRSYLRQAEGMVHKVGVRQFYADGIWLQDWTSPAYMARSRGHCGNQAGVGWRK